jgi:hypothetical protein
MLATAQNSQKRYFFQVCHLMILFIKSITTQIIEVCGGFHLCSLAIVEKSKKAGENVHIGQADAKFPTNPRILCF